MNYLWIFSGLIIFYFFVRYRLRLYDKKQEKLKEEKEKAFEFIKKKYKISNYLFARQFHILNYIYENIDYNDEKAMKEYLSRKVFIQSMYNSKKQVDEAHRKKAIREEKNKQELIVKYRDKENSSLKKEYNPEEWIGVKLTVSHFKNDIINSKSSKEVNENKKMLGFILSQMIKNQPTKFTPKLVEALLKWAESQIDEKELDEICLKELQ